MSSLRHGSGGGILLDLSRCVSHAPNAGVTPAPCRRRDGTRGVRRLKSLTLLKRKDTTMSLGLILVIILVIFLLGGFSGRFGGYGYGYGHGGIGLIGIILIILVVLLLTGRL
jgi:hypothetical protein